MPENVEEHWTVLEGHYSIQYVCAFNNLAGIVILQYPSIMWNPVKVKTKVKDYLQLLLSSGLVSAV